MEPAAPAPVSNFYLEPKASAPKLKIEAKSSNSGSKFLALVKIHKQLTNILLKTESKLAKSYLTVFLQLSHDLIQPCSHITQDLLSIYLDVVLKVVLQNVPQDFPKVILDILFEVILEVVLDGPVVV